VTSGSAAGTEGCDRATGEREFVSGLSGLFSEDDFEDISKLLSASVKGATKQRYQKHHQQYWLSFLQTRGLERDPYLLEYCVSDQRRYVIFIYCIFEKMEECEGRAEAEGSYYGRADPGGCRLVLAA